MRNKKTKYFVVGDIHGNLEGLMALLENWNENEEQLIFLGDLVSRGSNSLAVIQLVMSLVRDYGAICLQGNHELMLDEYLYEPTIYKGYLNPYVGGLETMKSFIFDLLSKGYDGEKLIKDDNLVKAILSEYPEEMKFITNLKKYHLTDKFMFVHAGIENDASAINEMTLQTILWGDPAFYTEPHIFDRTVVFGHYPTQRLGRKGAVYVSKCKRKVGIDGGGFMNSEDASIHGCLLEENRDIVVDYRYYSLSKDIEISVINLQG